MKNINKPFERSYWFEQVLRLKTAFCFGESPQKEPPEVSEAIQTGCDCRKPCAELLELHLALHVC